MVSPYLASAAARAAHQHGISGSDRDSEYEAQRILYTALPEFIAALKCAAEKTDLRKDVLADLMAVLDDATPDAEAWDEAISNARRGY